MAKITLEDILIVAKRESYQLRHHYLGVEHVSLAMLSFKAGLLSTIIQDYGLTPAYLADAIRRKVGKGNKQMGVGEVPTRRLNSIIHTAKDLAHKSGNTEADERDVLIAIIKDGDNLPLRVLWALGMDDTDQLLEEARTRILSKDYLQPQADIVYGNDYEMSIELTNEYKYILRRMFPTYGKIRIERQLTGGYTSATVLVVTPCRFDSHEDAAVVVKIDHVDKILDEAQSYDKYVRNTLPPVTARLEGRPVTSDNTQFNAMAGLRYTLVSDHDRIPQDLRMMIHDWQSEVLGRWLRDHLFEVFGRMWWQQNRFYRFQAWQEYDWLLPPLLTLEYVKSPPDGPVHTIGQTMKRSRARKLDYGDIVTIEGFYIQRAYPEQGRLQLAANHGSDAAKAYRIEIKNVDFDGKSYYRGELLESITGEVWKTRQEQLVQALLALQPDFDPPDADIIPVKTINPDRLDNPIIAYDQLLDYYVNGTFSIIHGDLHTGNIVIGPEHTNQIPFLIDFAHTRDGHTVFDWATLETSILSNVVILAFGHTWDDARVALREVMRVNRLIADNDAPDLTSLHPALLAVAHIRQVVKTLIHKGNWAEYFTALAFCGLRAVQWETISVPGRRLMFLVSALSMYELKHTFRPVSDTETPTPDDTNTIDRGQI